MSVIHKPYIGLDCPPDLYAGDLLQDVLPSRGLGFLVGEPGTCKSFLALKLCASLATVTPFIHNAHAIRQRNPNIGNSTGSYASLYLVGEREGGLPKRQKALIKSLEENYGIKGYEAGLPIITYAIRGHAYDQVSIDIPPFIKEQKAHLENLGYPLRLIVIDTLQSALHVPTENGNTEMQYAMNQLRNLAEKLDCFILIITHPAQTRGGHYSLKGVPRGATSMRGTADIIWYMEKVGNNGLHKLTVTKGSEGYCEGHSFFFTLMPYETSVALVPAETPPDKKYKSNDQSDTELTLNDVGVLKAMEFAYVEYGCADPFHEDMNIQSVTRKDMHAILKQKHTEEATKEEKKPVGDSAIGNRITRALERFLETELILSDQLEDGELFYYPAKSWEEMPSLIKLKFPSINFAKVSFL